MSSFFLSRWAPMPLTSPPAQKAVPAPVINSAPTPGFSPQVLIMVRSAGVRWSDSALRASGRFSVMTATRWRIAHNNSWVPVSMVMSAVVMLELPCAVCCRVQLKYGRHTRERGYPVIAAASRDSRRLGIPDHPRPRMMTSECVAASSIRNLEFLDPWPQFEFPGPCAARLLQHAPIAGGDGVGIEH